MYTSTKARFHLGTQLFVLGLLQIHILEIPQEYRVCQIHHIISVPGNSPLKALLLRQDLLPTHGTNDNIPPIGHGKCIMWSLSVAKQFG